MNPRISERPSWDQYFINLCEVVKTRSLDPHTQVGAVIVDDHHRIVSTGYNSYPAGCDETKMPYTRPEKYPFMVHADINSIVNAQRSVEGCTMYLPFLPCPDCMKAICAGKIKEIKYYGEYESAGCMNNDVVKKLAEATGIKLTRIEQEQYSSLGISTKEK
jgi:dCMP deaminase